MPKVYYNTIQRRKEKELSRNIDELMLRFGLISKEELHKKIVYFMV